MIGSVKSNVGKGISDTAYDVDSQYGYYDDSSNYNGDFEGGDSNDHLNIQQMDLQEKLQRWWIHSTISSMRNTTVFRTICGSQKSQTAETTC